jgi:hypothetical protein
MAFVNQPSKLLAKFLMAWVKVPETEPGVMQRRQGVPRSTPFSVGDDANVANAHHGGQATEREDRRETG